MSRNVQDMTWREFLAGLEQAGVSIAYLPNGPDGKRYPFLLRNNNGVPHWATLPKHFKDIDPDEPVGAYVFDSTLRRLGLNQPDHFPGWALVL